MSIFDKLFKRKRKLYAFEPDYIVPPSESINEAMEHAGVTIFDIWAAQPFVGNDDFLMMMHDHKQINKPMSKKLSSVLGGAPEFWVALSKNYFDALKLKGGSDEKD